MVKFLNARPGFDLTYDDVFMVPRRSSITSRLGEGTQVRLDLASEEIWENGQPVQGE